MHSWRNPIICNGCGKKYNYDKTGFFIAMLPVMLFSVIVLFGRFVIGGSINSDVAIAFYMAMVCSGFFSFYLIRRLKLNERI